MTTKTQQIKFKDADLMYWTVVIVSKSYIEESDFEVSITYYRSAFGYIGESDEQVEIAELHDVITDNLISTSDVWAMLAQYFVSIACAASADAKIINLEP